MRDLPSFMWMLARRILINPVVEIAFYVGCFFGVIYIGDKIEQHAVVLYEMLESLLDRLGTL